MGITRQDFSPKPAYAVFSAMTHVLKGTSFSRLVKLKNGTLVAFFLPQSDQENKAVVALWNPQLVTTLPVEFKDGANTGADETGLLINSAEFSFEKIVNAIGEEIPQSANIPLSKGPPVYLVLKRK